MNLLDYVHLRNIYRSTGVGRVSRELTEHLAVRPEVHLRVLADRGDHAAFVHKVGAPWTGYSYCFFEHETSRQQVRWYLTEQPVAESYWPDAEVVYCTAESYVPTRRARLAVACHDMQLFEPGAHAMNRWLLQQRAKWYLLFKRLEDQAHMIHTISEFSAGRIAHFFPGLRSRIRVIPNAVSASFFEPPTAAGVEAVASLGLADQPYLLVPGGLHFRKNAELVLGAWPEIHRRLPELKLAIGGHNNPAYVERAKALPGVHLAGFLDEDGLVALYHGAQAVWFPSRYEGFGMPVVEAMACGVPVVTSSTSACPEIAGDAAAALLSPDRPGDHVDALVALLRDSGARERAGQLGRERAGLFTWERSAAMLAQRLQQLL